MYIVDCIVHCILYSTMYTPNLHLIQDVTQTTGNKYYETFVQLRHNLMQSKTHIVSVGHITHSPKDYQAIGITLNLATRLYMRHLVCRTLIK